MSERFVLTSQSNPRQQAAKTEETMSADRKPAIRSGGLYVVSSGVRLPEPPEPANTARPGAVEMKRISRENACPVLESVQDDMGHRWLRGVSLERLADIYTDSVFGRPLRRDVENIVRAAVNRRLDGFLLRIHTQNAQLQRRAA